MSVHAVNGPVKLRLSVPAGRVEIEGGAATAVEIEVTPLRHDDATLSAVEATRIEAVERGGRHEIRVEVPRGKGGALLLGRQPKVGVVVRCPAGSDVDLESTSADLDLRVDCGDVSVKTASGDVTAGRVAALSVTSASGDVAVGSVDGELSVKTASGDIGARSVGGTAAVHSVSGDVTLGSVSDSCTVGTVSGDVSVERLAAELRANAVSGDVDVRVESGLRLWIDAQSVSGSMRSDLDLGDAPAADGGDVIELRIRTVSGDVDIRPA